MANYHKWTEEEVKVLTQYVKEGKSQKEIANELNLNVKQVTYKVFMLRKRGVKLPNNNLVWNNKMEKELATAVGKNEGNIQEAFRDFADKYNLTTNAVHSRWYDKKIKTGRVRDKYPAFGVFGRYRGIANSKIYSKEDSKGYTFWKMIKSIFV